MRQEREGSKRKEGEISPAGWNLLLLSQLLDANSGSNNTVWDVRARMECEDLESGHSRLTAEQKSSPLRSREHTRDGRKYYKVKERITKRCCRKS